MTLGFFNDGTNTVIAHDIEDAKELFAKFYGEPWKPEHGEHEEWRNGSAWDAKTPGLVSCMFEHMNDVPAYALGHIGVFQLPRGDVRVVMTEAEWIAGHGRGYFGSTES